jgi:hypothetical protein
MWATEFELIHKVLFDLLRLQMMTKTNQQCKMMGVIYLAVHHEQCGPEYPTLVIEVHCHFCRLWHHQQQQQQHPTQHLQILFCWQYVPIEI